MRSQPPTILSWMSEIREVRNTQAGRTSGIYPGQYSRFREVREYRRVLLAFIVQSKIPASSPLSQVPRTEVDSEQTSIDNPDEPKT